ncbi:hypothetical protein [Actinomadura nitritigenes]|uniref:hypothetical protein n=1 Tax=Actinomadura nitritigenes TaxID=134602 RepID=UPI003D91D6A3
MGRRLRRRLRHLADLAAAGRAPHAAEPASALFVAAFNVAISLGALAGGRVADTTGESGALWLGGALGGLGLAAALLGRRAERVGRPAPARPEGVPGPAVLDVSRCARPRSRRDR